MNVTEDKRYTRDTHIRVDSEFDQKLDTLREVSGIKTNSKAIRFAVSFAAAVLVMEKSEGGEEGGGRKPTELAIPGVQRNISGHAQVTEIAESLRHACVEIQLLAEDGRKHRYLSEEQFALLLSYQRELTKMMKEMLKV